MNNYQSLALYDTKIKSGMTLEDEEKIEIDWKDRPIELNETYYLTNDGFISQDDMDDYFYTKFEQYTGEEIYHELV